MHVAGNEHFLKPYPNACVTNYKIKGHCRDVPFLSPPPPTKDRWQVFFKHANEEQTLQISFFKER